MLLENLLLLCTPMIQPWYHILKILVQQIVHPQGNAYEARNYIQPSSHIAVPQQGQFGNQVHNQQHHVEPYVNTSIAPSFSCTNPSLQPTQQTSWVNYANSNSNIVPNTTNPPPTQQVASNMNPVQFSTIEQC